ncbi:hypothetical protein LINPERHAP1_LOCUS26483 [Linum perenne]
MRVSDLWIPATREWDVELIEESFNARDADSILRLPINEEVGLDQSIWKFSKTCTLSVSSAYRLWSDRMSQLDGDRVVGPWEEIWKVHAPPKLKIMAWRLARDIVPTRETIGR